MKCQRTEVVEEVGSVQVRARSGSFHTLLEQINALVSVLNLCQSHLLGHKVESNINKSWRETLCHTQQGGGFDPREEQSNPKLRSKLDFSH
jgi:hypothetical protein